MLIFYYSSIWVDKSQLIFPYSTHEFSNRGTKTSESGSKLDNDPISWEEPSRNKRLDIEQRIEFRRLFEESETDIYERIKMFPKYVQTTYLRKFITRYEIYKKILHVHGSIVECGVLGGDGIFTWANFTEIHEPYNHLRKIIGFDTFEGFPSISEEDKKFLTNQDGLGTGTTSQSSFLEKGGLTSSPFDELQQLITAFDLNRPLAHLEKIELIKGDAILTIPRYIDANPEVVCSLLWLDFDLYEPTAVALKHFLPRMPKGAILVFDELNHPLWPGETKAVLEECGINKLRVERFSFGSTASYAVIE